jgi:hypothetical protein
MTLKYYSRAYWNNYIDSIIDSIKEDKETIIDMLVYGRLVEANIKMDLSSEESPSYEFNVIKMGQKSPFGEEEDAE